MGSAPVNFSFQFCIYFDICLGVWSLAPDQSSLRFFSGKIWWVRKREACAAVLVSGNFCVAPEACEWQIGSGLVRGFKKKLNHM
jgi:hypothetical protein